MTLTQINLQVVDEASTKAQLMESGQLDVLTLTDLEYVNQWQPLVDNGTFVHVQTTTPSVTYLVVDQHVAGEGGPWGIAVLAGFAAMRKEGESLSAYLDAHVFANAKKETVNPTAEDMACFDDFLARYQSWLPAQKAAADCE